MTILIFFAIYLIALKWLDPEELNKIALIAPNATINIVKNAEVVEKQKVTLPEIIEGIVYCTNPNCISNDSREPITSKIKVEKKNRSAIFRCFYCEKMIEDPSRYLKY